MYIRIHIRIEKERERAMYMVCTDVCIYIYCIYAYMHIYTVYIYTVYIYIHVFIYIIRTCKRMMWGQVWTDLGDKKCVYSTNKLLKMLNIGPREHVSVSTKQLLGTSTVPGSRWEGFPLGSGHRESGPGKHLFNDFDGRIIYTVYTNRLKWLWKKYQLSLPNLR